MQLTSQIPHTWLNTSSSCSFSSLSSSPSSASKSSALVLSALWCFREELAVITCLISSTMHLTWLTSRSGPETWPKKCHNYHISWFFFWTGYTCIKWVLNPQVHDLTLHPILYGGRTIWARAHRPNILKLFRTIPPNHLSPTKNKQNKGSVFKTIRDDDNMYTKRCHNSKKHEEV